ncbi:hypothetical protein [Sphingobacterium faecale]|uniref:Uncharacterized protein n=1 Tax=Sphingobacterium faecale TaxID=2803775 RepID=A0ABS1R0H9_9SPHI|nr:hypothetical protein [Sphingobacterium faecale]MBL1408201.1 hypothetical protein [Sphingobacterium faecale]
MKKKNLIVVGNKPPTKHKLDLSKKIDSFDYVVRINKMNYYGETGTKIDGYFLEANSDFKYFHKGGPYKELIKHANQIFMRQYWYDNFQDWADFLLPAQYTSVEIINESYAMKDTGFERLTSVIKLIGYLVNSHWSELYTIHFTGLDLEWRDFIIDHNIGFEYHCGAGKLEKKYLKQLIKKEKIIQIKE